MKLSQRLAVELSQSRTKIQELAALDSPSDEQRGDLETRMAAHADLEKRYQAAVVSDGGEPAEPEPAEGSEGDAASRELRQLEQRASLSNIITAVVGQQATEGAELELQQHFGLQANYVPLSMLNLETRAVTPAPTNVGTSQASTIPYLFPKSCAEYLNVGQPTVPTGERLFPYIATPATVHAPAKGGAAAETTGSFATLTLSPKRLQSEFFYGVEDAARFAGLDMALRQNLVAALSDGLDKKIVEALIAGLTNPTDPTSTATFTTYQQLPYDQIDGRYACVASDAKFVVGAATYKHASGVYRTTDSDESGLDALMRVSGGVRVSSHIPAVASNVQGMIARLDGGNSMDAVAPIWDAVKILNDPYSKSSSGEVRLVAQMLYGVGIVRPDAYKRLEVKVS